MSLPNTSATPTKRDHLGVWLANLALRLTSETYRNFVRGSIEYGLRAAARDEAEGRPAPRPWRDTAAEINQVCRRSDMEDR